MTPKRRGFAAMDPEKQREIARKGGRAAHQKGTAHEFTPEEAREAGRKGGHSSHGRRQAASAEQSNGGQPSHGGSNGGPVESRDGLAMQEPTAPPHGPLDRPPALP